VAITTLTSREFNQDSSRAKKAARRGPVVITDRGKPAHVLLTIEDYQSLAGKRKNLADAIAMPAAAAISFRPARFGKELPRTAELD